MNAKLLYAATIAIALLGSSAAMATEATQIIVPAGTATRAAVQAELAQAKASGSYVAAHEGSERATAAVASDRARDEVRAEARAAARRHEFNALYVGA